ncbi:MAG: YraN family protein [Phycisphaerales bacterium]|nr:YraN family protein [Phycisphaerales bacterium]
MLRRLLERLGLARIKPVGARGEDAAAAYLRRAGYVILDRNVRVPVGEADIVAQLDSADGGRRTVVLVEVKTRTVDPAVKRPRAEEQVGAFKRRKLRAVMGHLVRSNPEWRGWRKRIDVVAVEFVNGESEPRVRHSVNAVGGF